jgi:NAD(P)H-hydrate epimerase
MTNKIKAELPTALFSAAQVRAMDKQAIGESRSRGFELMNLAGEYAFECLQVHWPREQCVTVFCGGGNNGGDGYIVAGLAAKAGYRVTLYALASPEDLAGDAAKALKFSIEQGVKPQTYYADNSSIEGIVVDALLGIGTHGNVRGSYRDAIVQINNAARPVISIDLPSGVCANTGAVLGIAVKADLTVSFIGLKQGLLTSDACECVGRLVFTDLGITPSIVSSQQPSCVRLHFDAPMLPRRQQNSHKGSFGQALVVGGDLGFGGAGIMAAESALLCGAGVVSLATREQHVSASLARRPELMVRGVQSALDLGPMFENSKVVVVGPGVGQSDWSREILGACLETKIPLVVDADGLNLLAGGYAEYRNTREWILTPHPGEAARMLGVSTAQVQSDRFAAAKALQEAYGGVIVLKGAGTIIASKSSLSLCSAGSPAMATPGMGDVLSGIIGSLLAQGFSSYESAQRGVWLHSTAADMTSRELGERIFATDIYRTLRKLL